MKRLDWYIMGPFLLLAIARILFDLLININIEQISLNLNSLSLANLHSSITGIVIISVFSVVAVVLFISCIISAYKLFEATLALVCISIAGYLFYTNEMANILLILEETALLFVTVMLAAIILHQKHIAYIALLAFTDGAYFMLCNNAEMMFLLKTNLAVAFSIAAVMCIQMCNLGEYFDKKDSISYWYNLENQWIAEDKAREKRL